MKSQGSETSSGRAGANRELYSPHVTILVFVSDVPYCAHCTLLFLARERLSLNALNRIVASGLIVLLHGGQGR